MAEYEYELGEHDEGGSSNSTYGQKSLTFTDILLSLIRKTHDALSREMHGGYHKQSQVSLDNNRILINETYVENTRKVFCNCVRSLYDLLYAKLLWEKPALRQKIEDAFDRCEAVTNWEDDACIIPFRNLLRLLHIHLDVNSYYAYGGGFDDGKPADLENLKDAYVKDGKTVLIYNDKKTEDKDA